MTAGSLRAVIWDMDGVIADTAEFHRAAWQEAFRKRGVQFTEELFRRTFGQRNETVIRTVLGQDVSQEEIDTIGDEKEADYRRRIERSIRALPGVSKLLASLAEKGWAGDCHLGAAGERPPNPGQPGHRGLLPGHRQRQGRYRGQTQSAGIPARLAEAGGPPAGLRCH